MRNLLWRAEAFGGSNIDWTGYSVSIKRWGVEMKLLPAIVVGFFLAFVTAFCIGYFMAMAIPLTYGSPEFYAVEFAGIIISMAVFYFAIRKTFRRHKRHETDYAERLA